MAGGVALVESVELPKAEGPWPLPEGWEWTALGTLGTWMGGGTPSKANVAFWTNGTVPWVSPKDMKVAVIGETEDKITAAAVEGSSAKYVPEGSVLMVMRSGILKHSFPVAVTDRIVTLNQDLRALTPHADISPNYIARYLALAANRVLEECSKDGTTVDSIEVSALERLRVPLASSAEQLRIVSLVDALFSEIAEGEAALAAARKGLDIFRRAVLKAASVGELTKDWRAANPMAETGHDLLTRIAKDRAGTPRTRTRRAVEAPPLDTSRLPILPEGWVWATLEQVGQIISGQTPTGIEKLVQTSGEIPWFKVSSMNDAGADGILVNSQWYLSGADAKRIGLHVIPVDAICFPKRGGSILTNKKRRLGVPGALDLNVMAYIPHHELREFAWFYFMNLDLKRIFDGSNVPQINYGDIAYLPIALPPPREAAEILRRVSDALSASADTLAILDAEAADAARLKQSILKAAFEGRLTSQDTADEPASALLVRLSENRKNRARSGRTRKSDV